MRQTRSSRRVASSRSAYWPSTVLSVSVSVVVSVGGVRRSSGPTCSPGGPRPRLRGPTNRWQESAERSRRHGCRRRGRSGRPRGPGPRRGPPRPGCPGGLSGALRGASSLGPRDLRLGSGLVGLPLRLGEAGGGRDRLVAQLVGVGTALLGLALGAHLHRDDDECGDDDDGHDEQDDLGAGQRIPPWFRPREDPRRQTYLFSPSFVTREQTTPRGGLKGYAGPRSLSRLSRRSAGRRVG